MSGQLSFPGAEVEPEPARELKVEDKYNLVWWWRSRPVGQDRKGQRCRIVARGKKNSVIVEFEDGYKVVTSRYAVRRAK